MFVEHNFVNIATLSWKQRVILVGGIFAVYTVLAALLYKVIGTQTFPLSVIPLVATGLLFRYRAVFVAWIVTLLINTWLLNINNYPGWDALVDAGGLLGFIVLLVSGLATVKVREINQALRQQLRERSLLDEEMQRRNAELEALRHASFQITHNLELKPILETIVETVLKLVHAEDVHVFSYDGQRLTFGAAYWHEQQQPKSISEPRPNGVTYTAARAGTPIIVPDTRGHPLYQGSSWNGAIIALPLSLGNQVNGVMNIAYNEPHNFNEDEMRILRLLAGQAAIAMQNAQLYEAARDQASELELRVHERTSELLEAKERAEALLNNSFDAIILFDPNTGIERTNHSFGTLFGYEAGDIEQQPISVLVQPQWREAFLGILRGVIATGQSMRTETVLIRQDGIDFNADVALAPILSQDAQRPNVICSVRDISRRKQAEAKQQAMTMGLRMVPAIANELISCPELDDTLREAVAAARNKLGVERCAIFVEREGYLWGTYGTDMKRLTTDEHINSFVINAKWQERLDQLTPGEAQWIVVEDTHYTWTGKEAVPVGKGWIAITRIESLAGFQGFFFNDSAINGNPVDETLQEVISVYCSLVGKIVERKQIEESIRQAFIKEVELGELKSRFITSISHEFRTPLSIIQSSTQLLKFYRDRMDEAKKEFSPGQNRKSDSADDLAAGQHHDDQPGRHRWFALSSTPARSGLIMQEYGRGTGINI